MRNQVGINPNMQNIDFYYKWLGSYPHYDSINKEGITLYEDPSRIGAVGSGLSLVPWQVGTFISKSSLR